MSQKIKFSIDPSNALFLHKDFIMEIPFLNYRFDFDTYYLALGKFIENENQLISIIKSYLNLCKKTILSLSKSQIIFLPIDFSDQYYGAFKVTRFDNDIFSFEYGTIEKTEKVIYKEPAQLQIKNEKFNVDFKILLTKIDVADSFRF